MTDSNEYSEITWQIDRNPNVLNVSATNLFSPDYDEIFRIRPTDFRRNNPIENNPIEVVNILAQYERIFKEPNKFIINENCDIKCPEENYECPICYEEVKTNNIGKLNCGHIYCGDCVNKLKTNCALCREIITNIEKNTNK